MFSTKILGLLVLVIFAGSAVASHSFQGPNELTRIDPHLLRYISGEVDAPLHASSESVYAFVALKPGSNPSTVNDLLSIKYPIGQSESPNLLYGEIHKSAILSLGARQAVAYVYPDIRIEFDRAKADQEIFSDKLATDMYRVREIIGANQVNQLGITGKGVTVAIVDSGTDFTIPDLQQAVARDGLGRAVSFDADGQGLVITNQVVHREGNVLKTANISVDVWNAASYVQTSSAIPAVQRVKINFNYGAPNVTSKSGDYHFGILRETIQDVDSSRTVTIDFPLVVIDSSFSHIYDTVMVDMSTAYYNFLNTYRTRLNSQATQSLGIGLRWPEPNPAWNVHSFASEVPHRVGSSDIIAFDPNATGVPNFGAGLLAFGIDLSGRTGRYMSLLPPIDPDGNFVNVSFDYESHGTSTASNVASRGIIKRDLYRNGTLISLPGIAPDAKIMGIKALWLGDITFGWYYAAGFDWTPADSTFKYTGQHRADIISNSWGDSNVIWDQGSTFGADYMSQLADAFSLPHYLDPSYPGTVMAIAAGNGGFGYGTTTSPAASTLAITVGASTSYAYRVQPSLTVRHEVAGGYDEVVPWSGRGPTSIGAPKPDIVDVGAFGFADQSLITGYGDGTKAYNVFGGTSMATPVTAGAIALLFQEYRDTHDGVDPRPDLTKSILTSTASDLNYDTFTQGSGRVDIYHAVAASAEGRDQRFPGRFFIQSTNSWDSVRRIIGKSWELNLKESPPDTPISATNWFAGVVNPGSSASASFNLIHATNPKATANIFQLMASKIYPSQTSGNVTWVTLSKDAIPHGTDLMKVTLVYHFTDFANISTWTVKDQLAAQLYDSYPDGSIARITNAAPQGTTSELVVSRPLDKFSGIPKVRIVFPDNKSSIPFELAVRYFTKVQWDWITKLDINGDVLEASLRIPNNVSPGVYAGSIAVYDGESETVIPISVVVPIVASGRYYEDAVVAPYQNFAVFGAFDWSWRYEAGDWRTFAIIVPTGVHRIGINVNWSDSETDIQAHLTNPSGYLVASSDFPTTKNMGKGKFYSDTSSSGPHQYIYTLDSAAGLYLLVLHNTLFGARTLTYPERYSLDVNFL